LEIARVNHAYTTAQYVANAVARATADFRPDMRAQAAAAELLTGLLLLAARSHNVAQKRGSVVSDTLPLAASAMI
jgi:hypothetical protein